MSSGRGVRIATSVVMGLVVISCLSVSLFAAGSEEGGWGWIKTFGRWVNLLILFGVIFYFAREPVATFLGSRSEAIRKEIGEAHEAREEAEQKLAAIEAQMRDLDAELDLMKVQAQKEAEQEKRRILEQAAEESEKIVTVTEREIEGLTRAARQNLRDYAVELSMEMAKEKIVAGMDSETQDKVIDRFLVRLTNADREGE